MICKNQEDGLCDRAIYISNIGFYNFDLAHYYKLEISLMLIQKFVKL